jgi:hypothetical protein
MTKEQEQYEVRSVKLKKKDKDEFTPEIVLWDPVRKRNEKFENCSNLGHKDFLKAVTRLADHMVILWNADSVDNFERSEKVQEFEARGYSKSGRDEELKITLKGHRLTTFAGAMTSNATILLDQDMDEDGAYPFCQDLQGKIKVIEAEVLAYCFEGRCYENPQLSLNMPDPEEKPKKPTKAQILPPVTPESIVGSIVNEANGKKGTGGKGNKKRTAQTPENKSGIIED